MPKGGSRMHRHFLKNTLCENSPIMRNTGNTFNQKEGAVSKEAALFILLKGRWKLILTTRFG